MRLMFGLVLLVGLGLAGFAVYMAQDRFTEYQSALENQRRALENRVPLTKIYVVNRQVRYGEKLRAEDLALLAWPEIAVPEGAFHEDDPIVSDDETLLRTVTRTMERGEPVLAVKVTEPGGEAGVSSRLTKGMRAFAIRVDVSTGVSGFLRPGDMVDVYWSGQAMGRNVTKLILDGVRLVAIDQIADADRTSPVIARTVTVEVTPKDVGTLAQAQATGDLSLALRGAEDDIEVGSVEIDQEQLLGLEVAAPVQAEEEEQVCTIRTRKGSEVVVIPIPCTDQF
jgi:pilus assembly protein CpaB